MQERIDAAARGRRMTMVSTLLLGIVLTLLAWFGLLAATIHGKYVTDKIAAGEYDKGPVERENT